MKYWFLFKARFLASAYAQASLASALGLMKTFAFLLFCLSPCFVQAQDITVVDFHKLENDLDAQMNHPVLDQNGQKCALIKVVTREKGFTFDAGQLGVRTVVVKDSLAEVWVYVPEGVKKLKITHPQLGQIKSDDGYYWFPEGGVDAATCYRMEITTARVITTIEEPEKRSGYLILTSEPSGASIYITVNGEEIYYGQTPMEGELLPYGTYRYRLAKSMYHQASGKIGVENGRVEKHIALQPAFGYLDIKTQPSDAQIIVEGQNTEYTSPCKLQLSSGTYKVRLTKKLYGTSEYEISIRDNQTTPLNATLVPKFAHLVVNTLTGASVYADGKFMGKGPKCEIDLLAGLHNIEAQLASHKTVKKQIEIIAKKDQEISLSPTPILGTLNIKPGSTNDATIFIDNKNYGKAPQVIDNILVGKHTVRLEKAGYESIVKEVVIEEGKTFLFEEKMENKLIPLTISPSSVNFPANGGMKRLNVLPLKGWYLGKVETPGSARSWLTVKSGDGYVQVKAKRNKTSLTRSGFFLIGTQKERQQIDIMQKGKVKSGYAYLVEDYLDDNLLFNMDWLKIGVGFGCPLVCARAETFSMRIGLFELRPLVLGLGLTYGADFDVSWDPSVGVILPIGFSWAGAMRGGFSWSTIMGLGGYVELAAIVNFDGCFSSDMFARAKIYQGRWWFDIGATINITRMRDY